MRYILGNNDGQPYYNISHQTLYILNDYTSHMTCTTIPFYTLAPSFTNSYCTQNEAIHVTTKYSKFNLI